MQERKLATIRKISSLSPIENADRIELAKVDGWNVIVNKGLYEVGSIVVYCEIDSFISNEVAPFLTAEGKEPKVYEGISGERLRTKRMKGVLSQGLILPFAVLTVEYDGSIEIRDWKEGDDVTEILGIVKWEPPMNPQLAGMVRGNFPALIPKTDAERIQNVRNIEELKTHTFEKTEKLHGTSVTFYLDDAGDFHVCSRNLDLKFSADNLYWKVALELNIDHRMKNLGLTGIAIQGEIIGEGLLGNQYGIKGHEFRMFNVFSTKTGSYLTAEFRERLAFQLGLKHVPVLCKNYIMPQNDTVNTLLVEADAPCVLNGSKREGFVLKSQQDPSVIIKCISNEWCLKHE